MTATHTPGPWAVIGTEVRWLADDETVTTITELEGLTPRQAANARLIAAAPELLAALQAVLPYLKGTESFAAQEAQARAAIARATGA